MPNGPAMTTHVRGAAATGADPRHLVTAERLAEGGWPSVFGRVAPLVVELGFGNGQSLAEMAAARPECDFVGIELFGKGIVKLSRRLERMGVTNVRIVQAHAVAALDAMFAPGSVDELHVNFPDPWPKRRHHKRRMVAPPFVELAFRQVRPGGVVQLATDFTCYAYQMRAVFEAHPGFVNLAGPHRFRYFIPGRFRTKYERKFAAQGATIRYLTYRRCGA